MTFLRIVIPLYLFDLSMISAQTRSAFVARENRYPLFRIMLQTAETRRVEIGGFRTLAGAWAGYRD